MSEDIPVEITAGLGLDDPPPPVQGPFFLKPKMSSRCLAVTNGYNPADAEGVACRLETVAPNRLSQLWDVVGEGRGVFQIRVRFQPNVGFSYVLDVFERQGREGQKVDQADANGSVAQKWTLIRQPNDPAKPGAWYELKSHVPEPDRQWRLDVNSGLDQENRAIDIANANGTPAQIWGFFIAR